MVTLFLVFKETSILFSLVAAPIYIPTNSVREFPFLHTLSLYLLFKLFKYFYISWWAAFAQAHCKASLTTFLELPGFPCEPVTKGLFLALLCEQCLHRKLSEYFEHHS